MQKILFIDRDGTLIEEPEDFQVDALEKIKFKPWVIPSLLALKKAGFLFVMVSNQDGLGTASFPQQDFDETQAFMLNLFRSQGIEFEAIFICPHTESCQCSCRKPKTGLLDDFLKSTTLDYANSWFLGDRPSDAELGNKIGLRSLTVTADFGWKEIESAILNNLKRKASLFRETLETRIAVEVILDSEEPSTINTPIPFFNHMLAQIAKHGGLTLKLDAEGDIEVDDHHLIEDVALVMGEACLLALGNKAGINRYGFTLPMDESLASVVIDLGGRSYCSFIGQFTREMVGGLATEMIPHFFRSMATGLKATLHIKVEGENNHHMIEACFKGLGLTLKQASQVQGERLPSTKGVL